LKAKRHIVHFVEATATGTLTMISLMVDLQTKAGCQVSVIYSLRQESPINLNELFPKEVKLINLQCSSVSQRIGSVLRLRKLLSHLKPCNLFLHSSYAGFIGRVATLAMPFECFYFPHCISFMRQDVSLPTKVLFLLLELIASMRKSRYVACSESERLALKNWIPFSEPLLIENAVDSKFWVNEIRWSQRSRIVVTCGQIRVQKGPSEFADIATKVKKLDPSIKFVWIGDGNDIKLKERLAKSGVEVTGWLDRVQIASIYRTAIECGLSGLAITLLW
jgi:glycosyltransferase involved in cell wall biosynthesis